MCWLPKASQRLRCRGADSDHRQAVRQGRTRAAPGVADLLAELDDAPRQRLDRVDLRKIRRRLTIGQLDAGGDADAILHRRHQEGILGVVDRVQQFARRIRLVLAVITPLGGERHAIAERPQQVGRPRPKRHHHMPRAQFTVGQHDAPAVAVRRNRSDLGTTHLAAAAGQHLRVSLHDIAGRIHRRGLGVQEANAVDRQDVRLQRRDCLTVEQLALDAVCGQRILIGFRRRKVVAAPGLQPAGLADALGRTRAHDPVAMQS